MVFAQPSNEKQEINNLIQTGHSIKTQNIDSIYMIANIAYEKSKKIKYELGITKALTLSSFYFYNIYKYDTAKFLLHKSLHHFTRFPKDKNIIDHGQVFLYLGYVAIKEFEYPLALIYAINALEIFEQKREIKYILHTLALLGEIESYQGNYAKGLAYYSNALRLKIENKYPEEKCITDFTNIAAIYMKIGQNEKAKQYSKKAFSLSLKHNDVFSQLTNLNNLGSLHSAIQEYDSAVYFYEQCVNFANKKNKIENRDIALYNLAELFNKTSQFEKSNRLAKKLIASEATVGLVRNAKIIIASNYLNQGKIDSAILIGSKLYNLFNNTPRNKESTIKLSDILAQAYKEKKKYDSALYYLTVKQTFSDSLLNINNQRKLGLLYADLDSLEKEKEIEILQKERLIRKKETTGYFIILGASTVIIALVSISIILFIRYKERNFKIISSALRRQLERRKRDLHQQTLKIIYMNNGLLEIESSLKKIQHQIDQQQSKDIDLMLETIQSNKTLEAEWQNFTAYFDQVYDQFTLKISNRFPSLSITEKRLILLIKMELKNREIASILNIDSASVKMAKYRLKKKLHLPEEIDVQQYLQNFN